MITAIEMAAAGFLANAEPEWKLSTLRARPDKYLFLTTATPVAFSDDFDAPTEDVVQEEPSDSQESIESILTQLEREVDAIIALADVKSKADESISQLLKLARFEDDWDGSGAAKPNTESLRIAQKFIRSLAPESEIPRPALHADGHVILFLKDKDRYAELEFIGDSKINYFLRSGIKECGDEISFDWRSLPQPLSDFGFKIES